AAATNEIGERGINLEVRMYGPQPVHQVQELDILAEPLSELLLKASDQIMSNAPAVQQEQRSEAPHAPVVSSSKAGASSQGGA
ncbi:hypothetical protein C0995_006791, partial [Termitomyces sp. Mi166